MSAIRYYTDDFDQEMLDFIENELHLEADNEDEWDITFNHLVYSSNLSWHWTCKLRNPEDYEYLTKQQYKEKIGMTSKTFTKADLVAGKHVVKFKGDINFYLVLEDSLINHTGWVDMDNLDSSLNCICNPDYDVVEVFEIDYKGFNTTNLKTGRYQQSIWKREEKSASQIELEKLQQQIADLTAQANKLQATL